MNENCENENCKATAAKSFNGKLLCSQCAVSLGLGSLCDGCKQIIPKNEIMCNYKSNFYHKDPCFQELKASLNIV